MNTNELREITIKVMREVIIDKNPKMTIRRLQDDNAFVIYTNFYVTDETGSNYQYSILMDIITEKTKPEFFKTIKNMIKIIDSAKEYKDLPSNHFLWFYPLKIKDSNHNIIANLIKFNPINTSILKYISADDELNIMRMLCNCVEFITKHKSMFDGFFPLNGSSYKYFRYGFVRMDFQTAEDEILEKVILDDLYGYSLTDDWGDSLTDDWDTDCATLKNRTQTIHYKTECPNEICRMENDDGCLSDAVLYYTAKSSLDCDKKVYLKGEFVYFPLTFNTNSGDIFKQYIIPRVWNTTTFEKFMYLYDAKIDYIACSNCGRDLITDKPF